MSATTYKLTSNTPIRISDGAKAVYVQEIRGRLTRFTCTTTQPNSNTVTSCVILNNDISISEGFPIWAWTEGAEIELAVLRAE